LVVPAALDRNKNPKGLLSALQFLGVFQPSVRVTVDWYGDQKVDPEQLPEIQQGIARLGLEGVFGLHPPADNIHEVVAQADAVILPSFHEGLPNAVCEGMMLGKPILMSDVCDARNLVQAGVNGYLFDPHSPESIANAVAAFARLGFDERLRMGMASRARAEVLFDIDTVVSHYLRVLDAAAARAHLEIEHWPGEVPSDIHE
jgi:glycosyltransferase involved in cell wall biosynthesis